MNDSRITPSNDHCLLKLSETFPRDSPYICIYEKVDNNDLDSSMATSTETSSMDTSPENNIGKDEKLKLSQSLMDFVAKDNEKYLQVKRCLLFEYPKQGIHGLLASLEQGLRHLLFL